MSMLPSRITSAATMAYSVYALVNPRHLGNQMEASTEDQPFYDRLAQAYGVRDLVIGGVGLAGPAPAVKVALGTRVAMDLADAALLGVRAPNGGVRAKVLVVTVGWAAVNAVVLARAQRS